MVAFLAGLVYIYFISHADGQVVSEGEMINEGMEGHREYQEKGDNEI